MFSNWTTHCEASTFKRLRCLFNSPAATSDISAIAVLKRHRSPFPDACLLRVDRFLAIDHLRNTLWIVSCGEPDQETEKRIAALKDCVPGRCHQQPVEFTLATERDEYLRLIAECRSRIAAGESYEICLTNQLRIRTDISPLAYYENLRKLNPAPHSAFLHFDDIDVACSSPERFHAYRHRRQCRIASY